MKKTIKVIVGIIVVLLILLIGFVATLPMTIGPLVKKGAAAAGPKVLGVDISVGDVKLKPIAGQLILSDLKIGNPEGYSEKDSFAVNSIDIELDTKSLVKGDTIYIERILIDAPAIFFETKDGMSNFDKMLEKAKKAEKEQKEKDAKDTDGKPKKKVVIGEFVLKDSKVGFASKLTFGKPITIPLPIVKVHDIGKSSGGVTGIEALGQIIPEIIGGLKDAVTGAVSSIGGGVTDMTKKGSEAVKAAADSAGAAAKNVTDSAGTAAKNVKDSAGKVTRNATDAAGKAASDVTDAAGKAAQDAGKKLKGLFGK